MTHPRTIALQRFATGDLPPDRQAAVRRHLAECPRCRAELEKIGDLRELLVGEPERRLPPLAWGRIQARILEDESVILPVGDVARRPTGRRRLLVAAAIVLLAAAGVFALVPRAGAQKSELTFDPAAPRAGDSVSVTYTPSGVLAGARNLVLRGRFRARTDGRVDGINPNLRVAVLTRGGDDAFHGRFRFPAAADYGIFVVEDAAATTIDTNAQRAWDLLAHDSTGRPTYDALDQRESESMGRSWEAAYQTAREIARLYPDSPASWSGLRSYESWVLGDAAADSLRASHLARLHELHARLLARAQASAEEESWMMWYARGLNESATFAYWRGRLLREYPAAPMAVQERVVDDLLRFRKARNYAGGLRAADALWREVGPAHDLLALFGFEMAGKSGDTAAVLRWADHYVTMRPHSADWVASRLAGLPALREEGLRRLRAELARVDRHDDVDRRLFATREEQRRSDRDAAAGLYAEIGKALLAAGRTRAGLDTLALAVAGPWDAALFAEVANARLAAGDSAGALELWARAAADPQTAAPAVDSARGRLGRAAAGVAWDSLVATTRADMRRRTLAVSMMKTPEEPIRLQDQQGETVTLKEVLGGRMGVVAFWSRFCGPALDELPNLERLAADLARRGASTILVTDEKPSPALAKFLHEKKVRVPVYSDSRREASLRLSSWGTPDLFVLDAGGRVRFHERPLERIPREVDALQQEAADNPVRAAANR